LGGEILTSIFPSSAQSRLLLEAQAPKGNRRITALPIVAAKARCIKARAEVPKGAQVAVLRKDRALKITCNPQRDLLNDPPALPRITGQDRPANPPKRGVGVGVQAPTKKRNTEEAAVDLDLGVVQDEARVQTVRTQILPSFLEFLVYIRAQGSAS